MAEQTDQTNRQPRIILTGLIAIGLLLRLWGAAPTIPYIPDTQIVREALQLGVLISSSDFVTTFTLFKYPLILPYLLALLYGTFFAGGWLGGEFNSTAAIQEYLFANVSLFHMIAIVVIAVLNTLVIPATYYTGKTIYNARKGLLAATLATFGLLNVHFSHQARPHAAVAFFFVLTLLATILLIQHGSRKYYILTGISAGLAAGTLPNGFLAFGFFGAGHLIRWWQHRPQTGRSLPFNRDLIWGILIGGVVVLLAYPHTIFNPNLLVSVEADNQVWLTGYAPISENSWSITYLKDHFLALLNYEPVLVILGLFGMVYGFFQPNRRPLHATITIFVGFYFLLFAPLVYAEARYFTPLPPFLALLSANLAFDLIDRLIDVNQRPGIHKTVSTGVILLLILPAISMSARLDWLLARPDTRTQATEWLLENTPPSTPIVLDTELPLTPSRASLQQQITQHPGSLGSKDQWLLNLPDHTYPQPNLDIYRLWVYTPETPQQLAALAPGGQTSLVILANPGTQPQTGWPDAYIAENAALLKTFSPAPASTSPGYFALPIDMPRAIHNLWAVDYPGPVVEIYRLPAN